MQCALRGNFPHAMMALVLLVLSLTTSPVTASATNALSAADETGDNYAQLKEVDNGTLVAEYQWRVFDIPRILEMRQGQTIPGPEFYSGQPGYKIRLSLTTGRVNPTDNMPYLGVWFTLVKGKFDEVMEWPFQYKFNITLVDQSFSAEAEHIHLSMNPMTAICRLLKQFHRPRSEKREGDGCGKAFFVPYYKLMNHSRYVVDGTILIRVIIFLEDRGAIPKRAKAYMRGHQLVSEFLWEVEDISGKIQQAREGLLSSVTSDLFYVNSESYLMVLQLTIHPEDEHLGLYATLVPGDFDDTLEWPFAYNFELSIIDQTLGYLTSDRKGVVDPTSGICSLSSFTKPQYQPNVPCGFRRLISFQMMESRNYKKNGNIMVKFTAILDQMPNFASVSIVDSHLVAEYSWRIPNIERKVQLGKSGKLTNLLSERFYTTDQGYLMQLQLKFQNRSDGFIGLYLTLLEGEHDSLLDWPFSKRFNLVIADQSPGDKAKDIVVSVDPKNPYVTNEACVGSFWRPFGRNDACGSSSTVGYDILHTRKYIRFGAVLVKVTVFLQEIHPPKFATLTVTDNHLAAEYEWMIPDIDDKVLQAKRGDLQFLDSEKFYLTNNGYRMMLRLYPEKSFGFVGLYAVLTKGVYDKELSWPFRNRYQLTVVDQDSHGKGVDVSRTTYPSTSSSGCPDVAFMRPEQELADWSCGEGRMISHETLNTRSYKRNGNLKVKIVVFLKELSPIVASLTFGRGSLLAEYAWLIENVEDKVSLLKDKELTKIESSVFYTSNQGYALRVSLALSPVAPSFQSLVNHKDQYMIGLYVTLYRGQFDALLRWPFAHIITLSISHRSSPLLDLVKSIDPKNTKCPSQAFQKPTDVHNEHSCGFAGLIALDRLKEYVSDGALIVKTAVVVGSLTAT